MKYEPKIVAFLCTWCSYTGADTAGIARIKSPANIRAVRVPCSGRVSPELIIRAFDQGADGVLVLGCHIGECHYDTGNHRAAKRLPILQSLMEYTGLEKERIRLDWVSASEGERFARIAEEFTDAIRALGPVRWRVTKERQQPSNIIVLEPIKAIPYQSTDSASKTDAIRIKAFELLKSEQVSCVIGYEVNNRGRTRPVFVYTPEETERLVWNPDCSNNLTTYLPGKLHHANKKEPGKPVAVVVKPCDSKTINVMVAENQIQRDQVFAIGISCEGIRDQAGNYQTRCVTCQEAVPVVSDTLISEATTSLVPRNSSDSITEMRQLQNISPSDRMNFWLEQFDRCIRCYACRQACPLCNCPVCLYERDDSIFVGSGIGLSEKRTYHLGRAYHLAGRCVGCNECERACPMEIPISLLNQKLVTEIEASFDYHAGLTVTPSPVVTVLSGEYKEG
jgi:coenzyme F420-reducing hydrogenase delta subunit/formate hydrogenlyase subunit 6/NADH:ubiquinone oxidoreductase subunit I